MRSGCSMEAPALLHRDIESHVTPELRQNVEASRAGERSSVSESLSLPLALFSGSHSTRACRVTGSRSGSEPTTPNTRPKAWLCTCRRMGLVSCFLIWIHRRGLRLSRLRNEDPAFYLLSCFSVIPSLMTCCQSVGQQNGMTPK